MPSPSSASAAVLARNHETFELSYRGKSEVGAEDPFTRPNSETSSQIKEARRHRPTPKPRPNPTSETSETFYFTTLIFCQS